MRAETAIAYQKAFVTILCLNFIVLRAAAVHDVQASLMHNVY